MINYKRDEYGQLSVTDSQFELWKHAWELIARAEKNGKISKSYDTIDFDRRKRASGSATHHEIYDIQPDPFQVLICVRETEGTHYGVKTTSKTYFIIKKNGQVIEAPKSKAAKAAKQSGCELGCAIAVCKGKKKLEATQFRACPDGIAYKKVAIIDGDIVSIYDNSSWALNIERAERAMQNHKGGFYVYETQRKAESAEFPDDSVNQDRDTHIVVKCNVSGNYCRYGSKLAFSNVTPIEIVRGLNV
jgi:hypothetical protein